MHINFSQIAHDIHLSLPTTAGPRKLKTLGGKPPITRPIARSTTEFECEFENGGHTSCPSIFWLYMYN